MLKYTINNEEDLGYFLEHHPSTCQTDWSKLLWNIINGDYLSNSLIYMERWSIIAFIAWTIRIHLNDVVFNKASDLVSKMVCSIPNLQNNMMRNWSTRTISV